VTRRTGTVARFRLGGTGGKSEHGNFEMFSAVIAIFPDSFSGVLNRMKGLWILDFLRSCG
jgi:hypothetical protein